MSRFGEEVFGGEFDEMVVTVLGVGDAGEFDGGEIVTKDKGNFGDNEFGVGGDNGGADDGVAAVSEELKKAVVKIVDFAGGKGA